MIISKRVEEGGVIQVLRVEGEDGMFLTFTPEGGDPTNRSLPQRRSGADYWVDLHVLTSKEARKIEAAMGVMSEKLEAIEIREAARELAAA